jgi:hypothetical protein
MKCPQCGTDEYSVSKECRVCGFQASQAEYLTTAVVPMNPEKRDVMNGFGLGCSTLAFIWFFVESLVFALAAHDPAKWSVYGPIASVVVPLLVGTVMYLLLRQKPSAFSRGVGLSLLVTIVFALMFAYVGTKFHDNKPAANGNGFE